MRMRKNNNAWVKATYPKVNLSPYPALQSGFVSSFFPPFFPSVFFLTTPARLRQLIPLSSPPVRISLKEEKKTSRAAHPHFIISIFHHKRAHLLKPNLVWQKDDEYKLYTNGFSFVWNIGVNTLWYLKKTNCPLLFLQTNQNWQLLPFTIAELFS